MPRERTSSKAISPPATALTPQPLIGVAASGITQYSLPFKVPGGRDERQALHYFSNFAAADLTGYLPSDFWSHTILQRCQHDAPVRHAAAALGRLHQEYVAADDPYTFEVSSETAEAYRKSVKALRTYLGRHAIPDRGMVLMCSAIFYCFELMRDDRRTALRHLHSGLDILREWHDGGQDPSINSKKDIVDVFARMDLQATIFDDRRQLGLALDEQVRLDFAAQLLPFRSAAEAQQDLFPLLHNAFGFLIDNVPHKFSNASAVPSSVLVQRARLLDRFNLWEQRTAGIQDGLQSDLIPSSQALCEAWLHCISIKLLVSHSLQDATMAAAPTFDDEADRLLELARSVLSMNRYNTLSSPTSTDPPRRHFSLHPGVVAPLALLAVKTLNPKVRYSAVLLLQEASGRREGFYDADQMVNVINGLAAKAGLYDPAGQPGLAPVVRRRHPYSTSALEWVIDDVTDVDDDEDEVERWKGFDRLLALVA